MKEIQIQKLTGSPSQDSVSKVAQGAEPEMLEEEMIRSADEIHGRRYGDKEVIDTIEEAFAQLFDSLATIIRR